MGAKTKLRAGLIAAVTVLGVTMAGAPAQAWGSYSWNDCFSGHVGESGYNINGYYWAGTHGGGCGYVAVAFRDGNSVYGLKKSSTSATYILITHDDTLQFIRTADGALHWSRSNGAPTQT